MAPRHAPRSDESSQHSDDVAQQEQMPVTEGVSPSQTASAMPIDTVSRCIGLDASRDFSTYGSAVGATAHHCYGYA